jgi:hypothetical protein
MKHHDLLRRLILRAPPDVVAAIYERARRRDRTNGESPSWQEIVGAAQGLGIFTTEEASTFLHLVVDRPGDAA